MKQIDRRSFLLATFCIPIPALLYSLQSCRLPSTTQHGCFVDGNRSQKNYKSNHARSIFYHDVSVPIQRHFKLYSMLVSVWVVDRCFRCSWTSWFLFSTQAYFYTQHSWGCRRTKPDTEKKTTQVTNGCAYVKHFHVISLNTPFSFVSQRYGAG